MRILHIITKLNEMYGAQRHAVESIHNHINNGHQCMLITGEVGVASNMAEEMGCIINKNNYLKNSYNIFILAKAVKHTVQAIENFNPDLVISHSSQGGVIARVACYQKKIPNIFTVQGWSFEKGTPFYQRAAGFVTEWLLKPFSDSYWCVSKFTAAYGIKSLKLKNKDRIYICGNMHVKKDDKTDGSIKVFNNVLMVAGFRNQKDHISAIKALEVLVNQKKISPIHFTFVGDGPNRAKIENQIKLSNVQKNITLVGETSNVDQYYDTCDMVILPTYYEGLPLSLIEAVQKNKPVIASDVAGNNEIVHEGLNGNLLAPDDYLSLASHITDYYINNKLSLLSAQSKEIYNKYLSYDIVSEKLNFIIHDAVKNSVFNKKK